MSIEDQIREMAVRYANSLKAVTDKRVKEMADDHTSHFLISLFQAAEQYAHEQGLSRSELYARAIQHYLRGGFTKAIRSDYG